MNIFYAVCLLLVGIALLYSLASALTAVWSRNIRHRTNKRMLTRFFSVCCRLGRVEPEERHRTARSNEASFRACCRPVEQVE